MDEKIIEKFNNSLTITINTLNDGEYAVFHSLVTELTSLTFDVFVGDKDSKTLFEDSMKKLDSTYKDIDADAYEFVLSKLVHNTFLIYNKVYDMISEIHQISPDDLTDKRTIVYLGRKLLYHLYYTDIRTWGTRNE